MANCCFKGTENQIEFGKLCKTKLLKPQGLESTDGIIVDAIMSSASS